jgi:hypothetical protein
MSSLVRAAVVLALAGAVASCASGDDSADSGAQGASTQPKSQLPVFSAARSDLCATDKGTLETAIEVFVTMNPGVTVSEQALVDAHLLKTTSQVWDVDAAGALVPAPGSGCV